MQLCQNLHVADLVRTVGGAQPLGLAAAEALL